MGMRAGIFLRGALGLVFLWVLTCMVPGVWAEDVSLGEITVTATRTEIPVTQAPASVTIITKKDMEQKRLMTIDEALKNEAGVYLRRTKGLMDSLASITLRGIPYQKRTLVLLDGVPINEGYEGGVSWGVLSTQDVSHIEVVRGPYSSLWGGNAMGGVVSLFSLLPERLTWWAKAGLGNGDEVTQGYRFGLGNRVGNLSFLLGFEKDNDLGYPTSLVVKKPESGNGTLLGGYPTTDPTGTELRWVVGDKGNNWAKRENYHGTLGWFFGENDLVKLSFQHGWLSYGYGPPHTYVHDASGISSFSGTVQVPNGQYVSISPYSFTYYAGIGRKKTDVLSVNVKKSFNTLLLKCTMGYLDRDSYWTKPSYPGDYYTASGEINKTSADTYYFDLNTSLPLMEDHFLTTGFSYRYDKADVDTSDMAFYRDPDSTLDKTYLAGGKVETLGLFLQDDWALVKKLHLFLGLRYDHWWTHDGYSGNVGQVENYPSRDKGTFSPKVALVWRPDDTTTLRVSYGKAFRAPNVYELYRTWTSSWGTTYHGNPDLDPEKAYSLEVGLKKRMWNKKIQFEVSLFQTWLRDMIYRQTIGSDKYWVNAGKGEIFGVEAGLTWKPLSWITAEVNYTRNDTKIVENEADPSSEGKRFIKTPPWMWNFHLAVEKGRLSAALWGHYVGKVFFEEDNSDVAEGVYGTAEKYFVADFKGTLHLTQLHILQMDMKADLSLAVNNLFDEDYWDYYRAPGRTWFLSLELKY
ncbi:TonB-dependent receptor [Thermodesulfatator atlanticus]|uniref:TonB-dependent receptor n=1 Tax=Thermodesulfatator atlanticus TaxID=501497 RepID=UPI0003B79FEA|nr:TonB-dependent receptor [Thermodesulfatator atlanticus]